MARNLQHPQHLFFQSTWVGADRKRRCYAKPSTSVATLWAAKTASKSWLLCGTTGWKLTADGRKQGIALCIPLLLPLNTVRCACMFLTELGFASCQIRVRLSLEHVVSYRRDISVVRAHGFNFHDSSNLLKFSSCRTLGRRNSHSADVCLFFLNDQSAEVERDISRSILKTFLLRQAGSFSFVRGPWTTKR